MLFLFNNVILDLGEDVSDTLQRAPSPLPLKEVKALPLMTIRLFIKEAVFATPNLPAKAPERAAVIACMINLRLEANSVMALLKKDATTPEDVYLRFTTAPEGVLANLKGLQDRHMLTFAVAELAVWDLAA